MVQIILINYQKHNRKIKQTCLEKYGVDCQFKRKDIIIKTLKKSWQRILTWKDYVIPLFTFDEYTGHNKKSNI